VGPTATAAKSITSSINYMEMYRFRYTLRGSCGTVVIHAYAYQNVPVRFLTNVKKPLLMCALRLAV
jgi:hypothetical protein